MKGLDHIQQEMNNGVNHPIDRVFYRIFVQSFFKQHAGLFLFLFMLFFSSFFYINYLGKMPAAESFFWHFILMITVISHQFMVMLFLGLAAFYSIKSMLFVWSVTRQPSSAFLLMSFAALPWTVQWRAWLRMQLGLTAPLWLYAFCCLIVAGIYHHLLYGLVIIFFLLLFTVIIACLNCARLLKLKEGVSGQRFIHWRVNSGMQIRLLLINYLLRKELVALVITKVISVTLLLVMRNWSMYEPLTPREWMLAILVISVAHLLISYKAAAFLSAALPIPGNLPIKKLTGFLFPGWSYALLLLPELFLLLAATSWTFSVYGWIMTLSFLWLFHYLSTGSDYSLTRLLKLCFLLLCADYLLILYQLSWVILLFNFLIAYKLFHDQFHLNPQRVF